MGSALARLCVGALARRRIRRCCSCDHVSPVARPAASHHDPAQDSAAASATTPGAAATPAGRAAASVASPSTAAASAASPFTATASRVASSGRRCDPTGGACAEAPQAKGSPRDETCESNGGTDTAPEAHEGGGRGSPDAGGGGNRRHI